MYILELAYHECCISNLWTKVLYLFQNNSHYVEVYFQKNEPLFEVYL